MPTLGDLITLGIFCGGCYALLVLAWRKWGPTVNTSPEVMSRASEKPSEDLALLKTDASLDRQTAPDLTYPKALTVDTCKVLRGCGLTRDQVRALVKPYGLTLDNNTWTAAKEPDAPSTPIAGRPTVAEFRESGDLAYKPLGDIHHP